MKLHLIKSWPFFAFVIVILIFFWKVFIGLAPIPGDFIVGTYYPWLDYKWGYSVGVPVKNPVTSDVVSIIYPLRSYAVDILKKGHLPLWNPLMFNGSPLLADFQVGILSPTILTYFFLPKIWAWTLQIVLQPLLAAIFTYLLLRNFKLSKTESFFGGVFYAFSGFNIIWMEWNTNTLVAAFIPLIILLLDKFINTNKLIWGVLLSVGIGLQMLSGYPQLVIFTMTSIFLLIIFRKYEITKQKFFLILTFICLGLFLSAIITIPGLELLLNSQRKYETLSADLIYLPWQHLITLLAPDYFGNPASGNYFGIGNYTINAGYSGLIVLELALIGIISFWKRIEVKYYVCLTILALLTALPTPFAKALFNSSVPGISASSNTRILVLVNLSLSILAGFGLAALFKKEKFTGYKILFIPLLILLIVLVLTFLGNIYKNVSLRNLILPIVLSLSIVILVYLRNIFIQIKSLRNIFVFALCFLGVLELFRYGWKYTPFSSPSLVFPETPSLTYFKNDKEIYRVSPGDVIPMNMWVPYNIESVSGYDAIYPIWWARLFGVIGGQNPDKPDLSYYAPFEKYDNPWFDFLNNKYLFVYDPSKLNDKNRYSLFDRINHSEKFVKVFQDKSVGIFKNNRSLPRAMFFTNWEVMPDQEMLHTLADPNFPIKEKILINIDTSLKKSLGVQSKITYDNYIPEKSTINIITDKEGFLFVTDSWFPGWKALVDGVETPIFKTDYAFRAVPILMGSHKVEFIYDPISLKAGRALSLASLLFLFGIYFYERKTYKKQNE